jgi:hypothetical protein
MTKKRVSYAITDNNVTVNYDGQTHIVARTDTLADRLIKALREGRTDDIPNLVSAAKRIENFSKGTFVVRDGEILVNGQPAPRVLGNKIVKFANDGLPYQPLVKFAENLQRNPSFRAVNELFTFLEKNDHPITDDGNFIAYKRVRGTFKDIHSNTFDNSVGTTVEMPRNQVNEDSAQTCSAGLHVANWTYAHTQFASNDPATDVMLEVEVNPADVVSIPVDYDNAKMRVCKYKVLGVVDKAHSSDVQLRKTYDDCSDHGELDDDRKADEDIDDEEEENTCHVCGDVTDEGYDICEDCELEADEEDEEDEEDYPFDRELF